MGSNAVVPGIPGRRAGCLAPLLRDFLLLRRGRAAAEHARDELERRIAETKAAYRDAKDPVYRPRAATAVTRTGAAVRATPHAGTPGGAGDRTELVADDAEDTE